MIFSHAVRHALVEPGMAKISVLLATPLPHEIATWKCQSLQTTTYGTLHQNLHLTVEQRQQCFGSLITFRQASTTRNQYHLYIVAGDPRRYLSANSVAVFFSQWLYRQRDGPLLAPNRADSDRGIVFFTATIRNRKNSNTGRDKFSAYLDSSDLLLTF